MWSCDQKCYCNHQSCFPAWHSPGQCLTPRMTCAEHGAPASCRGARSCLQPAAVSDTLSSQQPPCGVRASHPGRISETIPRRQSHTGRRQVPNAQEEELLCPLLHTHPHEFSPALSPLGATSFIFPPEQSPGSCFLMIMVLELSHITLRPTHSPWRFAAVLENTYLN